MKDSVSFSDKICVLLVDDHAIVREGISAFLALHDDIVVVAEASSGEQAVILAEELLPDIVLMDLLMPEGIGGIEATRQIRLRSPHTQVIILTSYHDDEYIFPAIRAGALSYVLKNIDAAMLVKAIRQAASGEATMSSLVAMRLMREFKDEKKLPDSTNMQLTERELEVLQNIANGKTNAEIAENICVTIKTVRAHVSNILSKLHLKDRTQVAVYAWREGLVKNKLE